MTDATGPQRVNDGPSILGQPRVVPGPGPAAHNDARHGWAYE